MKLFRIWICACLCFFLFIGLSAIGGHAAPANDGNAGLETMVFGLLAGRSAVANTQMDTPLPEDAAVVADKEPDADIPALRAKLQQIMRKSLNVIRCEADLQWGIAQVREMMAQLGEHRNCYQKHRLFNDLLTARITLVSALTRTGSIGCHHRADGVAEESAYRVVIHQDGEAMNARRLSL